MVYRCGDATYTAGEIADIRRTRGGDGTVEFRNGGVVCVATGDIMQDESDDGPSDGSIVATEKTTKTERTPEGSRTITESTTDRDGEISTSTTTTNNVEDQIRWQNLGYYDRLDKIGGGPLYTKVSETYAEELPNRLRSESGGTDSPEYKAFIQGLKGYFGQSFESYTSADAAWSRVVEDAKAGNTAAMELLQRGRGSFDPKDFEKGSRGPGSSGPRYTITNANEEDVYTIAQSLAMEMIGRPITEKQFGKLLSRVRQEEKANPTVTRTVGNTTTTETGITDQERQSVMAELLQERPEWRQHQMSQGVLDALTRSIQEGKRLDSGV